MAIEFLFRFAGCQIEAADFDVEEFAVVAFELVGAFHGSPFGGEGAVAGVFEGGSGGEAGLFADDAFAFDFALPGGVDDNPVAGAEGGGAGAFVGDDDAVAVHEVALVDVGFLGEVEGGGSDADAVGGDVAEVWGGHGGILWGTYGRDYIRKRVSGFCGRR